MSLELAIECFNNAKLRFYWKMISEDTLGCKWRQANLGWCKWWEWNSLAYITERSCWRFASVMAGGRGSDTFIRTTWSLSLLESSLCWLRLRQARPSGGPWKRPLAFVLPSSHYLQWKELLFPTKVPGVTLFCGLESREPASVCHWSQGDGCGCVKCPSLSWDVVSVP